MAISVRGLIPQRYSHCSPTLTPFYPSEQITPHSYLNFTPLGSPTLTSFHPLWTNYPLTLTPFYPSWQTNCYILKPLLNKIPPHSYTILPPPPLASQLLHHFTPSEQITPYSYTILPPWAVRLLHHFTPSEQITPSLLHHFTPLGSSSLSSCYPLWTN